MFLIISMLMLYVKYKTLHLHTWILLQHNFFIGLCKTDGDQNIKHYQNIWGPLSEQWLS